jgi:hemerythrin-like domain-containing protein
MIEQEYLAFAAAFQAEHREMRRLVQVLRHALGKEEGGWTRESAHEALEAFEALKAHLKEHFAQEEEGGYLEQALAVAPRYSDEAKLLLKQHGLMTRQVAHAVETAKRALDEPGAWATLETEARELLQKLVEHETAENRIVQKALNTGIEAE